MAWAERERRLTTERCGWRRDKDASGTLFLPPVTMLLTRPPARPPAWRIRYLLCVSTRCVRVASVLRWRGWASKHIQLSSARCIPASRDGALPNTISSLARLSANSSMVSSPVNPRRWLVQISLHQLHYSLFFFPGRQLRSPSSPAASYLDNVPSRSKAIVHAIHAYARNDERCVSTR